MTNHVATEHMAAGRIRRWQSWKWFAVGFLIVFIGMSLVTTVPHLHPSRHAIVRSKLWQYYSMKIPRMVSSHELGPSDVQDPPVGFVMLLHLISAVGGGAATLGLGYVIRWRSRA